MRSAEQPYQSREPDQEQDRIHGNDLLLDEPQRTEHDVLSLATHILQILERWKMTVRLPDQIGQEERDRDGAGNPDPGLGKFAAMMGEQQSNRYRETEEECGMLVLEAQTRQYAEPDPQTRVARAQDARDHQNAAHPVQRLERIHGQQAVSDQYRRA